MNKGAQWYSIGVSSLSNSWDDRRWAHADGVCAWTTRVVLYTIVALLTNSTYWPLPPFLMQHFQPEISV